MSLFPLLSKNSLLLCKSHSKNSKLAKLRLLSASHTFKHSRPFKTRKLQLLRKKRNTQALQPFDGGNRFEHDGLPGALQGPSPQSKKSSAGRKITTKTHRKNGEKKKLHLRFFQLPSLHLPFASKSDFCYVRDAFKAQPTTHI